MKPVRLFARWLCAALVCLLLAGCGPLRELALFGSEAAASSAEEKLPAIAEGENRFLLTPYPLAEGGLTPLLEATAARRDRPLAATCNIGSFVLRVDGQGRLVRASVQVWEFEGTPPIYDAGFSISWSAADRQLVYETEHNYLLDSNPNDNLTLDVVNENLGALPVSSLLALLPDGFEVSFQPFRRPETGAPIVDMRAAPDSLDPALYTAGSYGTADGSPQWMLTVYGDDEAFQSSWPFCFAPAVPEQWLGRPDLYSQYSVSCTEDALRYTRDWGETWQDVPYHSLGQETIDAYSGITRSSWSIWPEEGGPVAMLLGDGATLVWTMDGETWQSETFPSGRNPVDRRTAVMLPNGRGFVSYGGEWTPGSGGYSALYFTQDAGETWTPAPTQPSDRSVCGAGMLEDGTLMVTVETSSGNNWPAVFVTTDDGASWTQLNMPWTDAEAQNIGWLYRLDSLTRDPDGRLRARFTQEPMGTRVAEMVANAPTGYWSFDRALRERG